MKEITIEQKVNKVEVVELMDEIRDMIFAGRLASMKEIKHECWKHNDDLEIWEQEWLLREMYAYYIINCEVMNMVPVSGYKD